MLFSISLYISLTICVLGMGYRIWTWFRLEVGPVAERHSSSERAVFAMKSVASTLFSASMLDVLKALFLDAFLQRRIRTEDNLRWIMHMCIFWGFILLVFMHALVLRQTDQITINPPLFFRNLFGVMVFIGIGIAIYRRWKLKGMRRLTRGLDIYAIIIVTVIMVTGFFLETVKIVSSPVFSEMVQEYAKVNDHMGLRPLRVYWAEKYGSVFPGQVMINDKATLSEGKVMHEGLCARCHDQPGWAFLSYPVSKITKPVVANMAMFRADRLLLPIHFLAVFIGLAYLPFSKFFHIFSSPVALAVAEVMDNETAHPANIATRRAMELDACTHCGTCSMRCSVGIVFDMIPNINILPSEKLVALRTLASGKNLTPKELHAIQEGSYICTSCYRCTNVCPVGINLQDLWFAMKDKLSEQGYPDLQTWVREAGAIEISEKLKDRTSPLTTNGRSLRRHFSLSSQASTFSACFECQTCTNVCPVVANYENPSEDLDLAPHQIMHSLGLGLRDLALDSRMLWDCLTCYQCQENCPQGVQVTDVIYELKQMAYARLRASSQVGDLSKDALEAASGMDKGEIS